MQHFGALPGDALGGIALFAHAFAFDHLALPGFDDAAFPGLALGRVALGGQAFLPLRRLVFGRGACALLFACTLLDRLPFLRLALATHLLLSTCAARCCPAAAAWALRSCWRASSRCFCLSCLSCCFSCVVAGSRANAGAPMPSASVAPITAARTVRWMDLLTFMAILGVACEQAVLVRNALHAKST